MCLKTLGDKVRRLGMAAMYEGHLEHGRFRGLLDDGSAEWAATAVPLKVGDLKALEAAGVPVAEVIDNYLDTRAGPDGGGGDALGGLAGAMLAYRRTGYAPELPPDVEAAVRARGEATAPVAVAGAAGSPEAS